MSVRMWWTQTLIASRLLTLSFIMIIVTAWISVCHFHCSNCSIRSLWRQGNLLQFILLRPWDCHIWIIPNACPPITNTPQIPIPILHQTSVRWVTSIQIRTRPKVSPHHRCPQPLVRLRHPTRVCFFFFDRHSLVLSLILGDVLGLRIPDSASESGIIPAQDEEQLESFAEIQPWRIHSQPFETNKLISPSVNEPDYDSRSKPVSKLNALMIRYVKEADFSALLFSMSLSVPSKGFLRPAQNRESGDREWGTHYLILDFERLSDHWMMSWTMQERCL